MAVEALDDAELALDDAALAELEANPACVVAVAALADALLA